jgi:hypothetical protein
MGGGDDAAGEARLREEQRQKQIAIGQQRIDEQFKMFNDPYFAEAEKDYLAFYTPDLEKRYGDAQKQLVYLLNNNGNLNSSAGAKSFADLANERSLHETRISNQALDFSSSLRNSIEQARSELYRQNSDAANPSAAARAATQRALMLSQPQQFDPLGDIFAQFTNQAATRMQAGNNREIDLAKPIQFDNSGSGSYRVIS